jgi:hypothetical protein
VLEQGRAKSAYRFPGVGELHFVRARTRRILVMLASLVGIIARALDGARRARYYLPEDLPSGYNDPVTDRFVLDTGCRRKRRVPSTCFERASDA